MNTNHHEPSVTLTKYKTLQPINTPFTITSLSMTPPSFYHPHPPPLTPTHTHPATHPQARLLATPDKEGQLRQIPPYKGPITSRPVPVSSTGSSSGPSPGPLSNTAMDGSRTSEKEGSSRFFGGGLLPPPPPGKCC